MMEILSAKAPRATQDGDINLEIEHPVYGWIPFHATPTDTEAHGRELYQRALAGEFGPVVPYVAPILTKEQKIAAITVAVQLHLDAPAQALGYDDLKTACTYAEEPSVPIFQQQGQAFRAWRSLVWAKCYQILGEVEAETRTEPTIAELLAELPVLNL